MDGFSKLCYLLPLIYSLLLGCTSQGIKEEAAIHVSTQTLKLLPGSSGSNFKFIFNGSDGEGYAYNDDQGKLYQFNIGGVSSVIPFDSILDVNGYNSIVHDIGVIAQDSIILYGDSTIDLMTVRDLSIKTLYSINTDSDAIFTDLGLYRSSLKSFPVSYVKCISSIAQYAYSFKHNGLGGQFFKFPVEVVQKIHSPNMPLVTPVIWPSNYDNANFGFLDQIYRFNAQDCKATFSFPIDNQCYIYNYIENKIDTLYNFKVDNDSPTEIEGDSSSTGKLRHLVESSAYSYLVPLDNNIFVRFHRGGLPKKNTDGKFNKYGDKPFILLYGRDNNSPVETFELPLRTFDPDLFIVLDGTLLLYRKHYLNKDSLNDSGHFQQYSFE